MNSDAIRRALAATAIAGAFAAGAVAGAVDLFRVALQFGAADHASAWTASARERVRRVILELAPAVEAVRDQVPESAPVWCWATTSNASVYHLFYYLQTLLYPRDFWRPESVGVMTSPADIPRDAPYGCACVVLHVPGDEPLRNVPPPRPPRGRWRAASRSPYATVWVLEDAP